VTEAALEVSARRMSIGWSFWQCGAGTLGRDRCLVKDAKEANMPAPMQDHIYRVIELVGSSETSIEDAISTAIARAHKTLRNLRWFEVVQTRGHVENGKVAHYQVTLKVGFTMEEAA
jgi:flavin-binding protein dodecin